MSSDRLTEILNFLSAISRDVGAFRAETSARLDRLETDVRELRGEVRAIVTRLDRLESRVLDIRANQRDLEDRVAALEGKQA